MTKDLTAGSVPKTLLLFSLPLLLSTLLQQFYNIADSMIVGRFVGETGLAAIGAAYPITLFFVAVATGASMGCSVVISHLFGAGQRDRLYNAAFTALISFAVLGVILSLTGILLSGPLMLLLNAPDEIFSEAKAYLAIYAAGMLAMLLYNAAGGIFTGLGESRMPLYLLFVSSVINVVLDYIAVRFFHWGVVGAAWATTVSQCIAALLGCAILVKRMKVIKPVGAQLRFSRDSMAEIARSAVPCILQQSSVALGHTILQGILNTYDTAIIAGYEAASKLHNFVYMSINTLGTALSAFAAQCCGAGKQKRVRGGFRVTLLICLGCAAIVLVLFQLFPSALIGLFIDGQQSPLVMESGVTYLRMISPLYFPISMIVATGGLLRGTGRSTAFFVETLMEFAVRIVMCFILTGVLASYVGLLWGWCCGSTSGFLMCVALTVHTFRTRLRSENYHI